MPMNTKSAIISDEYMSTGVLKRAVSKSLANNLLIVLIIKNLIGYIRNVTKAILPRNEKIALIIFILKFDWYKITFLRNDVI